MRGERERIRVHDLPQRPAFWSPVRNRRAVTPNGTGLLAFDLDSSNHRRMRIASFLLVATLVFGATSTSADSPSSDAPKKTATTKAPHRYKVELNTTRGRIVIDVHRAWAPRGADRFYQLVKMGYYTDIAFFRVISGFMAQFGIHGDPKVNEKWRNKAMKDDPVMASNTRGTVTFATSGPDSRTTQLFINFADNSRLDGMGFAPFGKVADMKAVDALYSGYGEGAPMGRGPSQAEMQSRGNAYLKASFPKLDYIKSAKILK